MPEISHHHKRSRRIIQSFEDKSKQHRTFTMKLADFLTHYMSTVVFLTLNIIFFIIWFLINLQILPVVPVFDPYPFVLLITFVSLEAIILSITVLISQKREHQISTVRDELQLQVELLTEKQISKMLELQKKTMEKLREKIEDEELDDMIKTIDASYIERKLQEQINN
jgi:uncharacterized membrane protein